MSKYTFEPTLRLRLEVERDPNPGEYLNRIPNPSGELGAWGWITPTLGDGSTASLRRWDYDGAPTLQYTTVGGQANFFYTTPFKVVPGSQLRAAWLLRDAPVAGYKAGFKWYTINGDEIASSAYDNVAVPGNSWTSAHTVPATVHFAALTFAVTKADFTDPYPASGSHFAVRDVRTFMTGNGISLSDTAMAANAGAPSTLWANVMGPTHEITVTREEFNLGTMSATILDSTLDPAVATTLRPGRKVRLIALNRSEIGWDRLFTGTVDSANVEYDLRTRDTSDPKHARISLTAVDAMSVLGNTKRRLGVATIAELPWALEGNDNFVTQGLAIPWDCDNISGHVATAVVTSTNDNASAADQISLTRDGALGYAWVDRSGVLRGKTILPTTAVELDESVYSDLEISFDSTRLINVVTITVLHYDAVENETTETTVGPFVDAASVREWGRRQRTFTVSDTALTARGGGQAFADAVFAANATPRTVPVRVSVPILTDPDRVARAFTDLYQLTRVTHVEKGIDEYMRVTSIRHMITTDMWIMDFGFAAADAVAIPQRQPAL